MKNKTKRKTSPGTGRYKKDDARSQNSCEYLDKITKCNIAKTSRKVIK
jgi:hypothetical protein